MTTDELNKRIKSLEKNEKVLKRLYFVKFRYKGYSVEKAAKMIGVTKMVGYIWQARWNKNGYNGLIPKFAGGRPSKLTNEQKEDLKSTLKQRDDWTTEDVRKLMHDKFGVTYSLKQVRIILRKFGMKYGKPSLHDRRPSNAEEILKKLPEIDENTIIGFLDETSPQTTVKCWSFTKPEIIKNTAKYKVNAIGFYPINGTPVIDFKEHSKKEDICEFLALVRSNNPGKRIIIILDNFPSHKARYTKNIANNLLIDLVYLPPYSPDLNPIEFIWKSIKRIISKEFINNVEHMKTIIKINFERISSSLSFVKTWNNKFLTYKYKMLGI